MRSGIMDVFIYWFFHILGLTSRASPGNERHDHPRQEHHHEGVEDNVVQDKIPILKQAAERQSQEHDHWNYSEIGCDRHFPCGGKWRAVLAKERFEAVEFASLRLAVRERGHSLFPVKVQWRSIEGVALGGV